MQIFAKISRKYIRKILSRFDEYCCPFISNNNKIKVRLILFAFATILLNRLPCFYWIRTVIMDAGTKRASVASRGEGIEKKSIVEVSLLYHGNQEVRNLSWYCSFISMHEKYHITISKNIWRSCFREYFSNIFGNIAQCKGTLRNNY